MFGILDFKRMSFVTNQYILRTGQTAEDQYLEIFTPILLVYNDPPSDQLSVIVPPSDQLSVIANVLTGMYSVRFNGDTSRQETSTQVQSVPHDATPPREFPFISTLES